MASACRAWTVVVLCVLLALPTATADLVGAVELPARRARAKMAADKRYPGAPPSAGETARPPAVVFVEGVPSEVPPPALTAPLTVEQVNRQFRPMILPVPVGATVSFPNRDDEYHNVFSRSEAKELELGRFGQGESREVTFDRPGIVRLRCEVHSGMHAVVLVLPTRWFTVCAEDGTFALKGLPAGKYRVYAFHEDARPQEKGGDPMRAWGKEVEVTAKGDTRVDFDLSGKSP